MQYKIEKLPENIYYGYSWQSDINIDCTKFFEEFKETINSMEVDSFIIKILPDSEEKTNYSIGAKYSTDETDISKYDKIIFPKGNYAQVLLTDSAKEAIVNAYHTVEKKFILSKTSELYLVGRYQEDKFTTELLIPVLREKTLTDRIKEPLKNPKVQLAIVAVAVAVVGLASYYYYTSNSETEELTGNVDELNLEDDLQTDNRDDLLMEIDRKAPIEHVVSAYFQHYHTNEGTVLKEIAPYVRGGKSNED